MNTDFPGCVASTPMKESHENKAASLIPPQAAPVPKTEPLEGSGAYLEFPLKCPISATWQQLNT